MWGIRRGGRRALAAAPPRRKKKCCFFAVSSFSSPFSQTTLLFFLSLSTSICNTKIPKSNPKPPGSISQFERKEKEKRKDYTFVKVLRLLVCDVVWLCVCCSRVRAWFCVCVLCARVALCVVVCRVCVTRCRVIGFVVVVTAAVCVLGVTNWLQTRLGFEAWGRESVFGSVCDVRCDCSWPFLCVYCAM